MNTKPSDLAGRTALVTGAGKRIGRTVALALAGAGANVIVHYNSSQDQAENLASEIRRYGPQAWAIQADLSRPEEVTGLVPRVKDLVGAFHILINNASIFPSDTLQDVTSESLALNEQINAFAPFLLSREFAAQGIKGDIINYLDTRIVDYDARHFAYHISKRTLFTLTQVMAAEFAPRIQVNAVAPGLILPPEGKDESFLANLAHTNPLQRFGSPEEIAAATLFLLRSEFITGQVIYVDGGRHLKGAFHGGC